MAGPSWVVMLDGAEQGMGGARRAKLVRRAVGAAVVDAHRLEAEHRQVARHFVQQRADVARLVLRRHDDGQLRAARIRRWDPPLRHCHEKNRYLPGMPPVAGYSEVSAF